MRKHEVGDQGSPREGEVAASRPPARWVLCLSVAVLCLVWGSTWIVIQGGLADLPPLSSAAMRFAIAALVMVILAPRVQRWEGGRAPGLGLTLVMGLASLALPYGIIYWVETRLPSGLVSVLWSVFPVLMAIAAHFQLPGERLRGRQWLGVLVGFGGVAVLLGIDVTALGEGALPAAGVLLLSPVLSALGTTAVKRHGQEVSSALLNRNGMALCALVLAAGAWTLEGEAPLRWTPTAVASVLYLALVGTVVTFGLYFWTLRYLPATKMSLIAYVTPAIALLLGVSFGGESVGPSTLSGSAAVLGGIALVLVDGRRRDRPVDGRHPADGA